MLKIEKIKSFNSQKNVFDKSHKREVKEEKEIKIDIKNLQHNVPTVICGSPKTP